MASKLTPERVDRICELAATRMFLADIAADVGVGDRTLRRWRDEGREALNREDDGETLTDHERLCAEFYRRFTSAEAELKRQCLEDIWEDRRNYAAIAWFLERRWPKQFGRGQRLEIEHSGQIDGQSAVIVLPANGREASLPGEGDAER